jgi:hypothetical protein
MKIIDKSKKEDLKSEPNHELLRNLDMLQAYARNFIKNKQLSDLNESMENSSSSSLNDQDSQNDPNSGEESISQPELESIMPCVKIINLF